MVGSRALHKKSLHHSLSSLQHTPHDPALGKSLLQLSGYPSSALSPYLPSSVPQVNVGQPYLPPCHLQLVHLADPALALTPSGKLSIMPWVWDILNGLLPKPLPNSTSPAKPLTGNRQSSRFVQGKRWGLTVSLRLSQQHSRAGEPQRLLPVDLRWEI